MKRVFALALVLVSVTFLIQAIFAASVLARPEKVIIGFSGRPDKQDEDNILARGGKIKYKYDIIPAMAVEVPGEALNGIMKNPRVSYVEQDQILQIAATPNDPSFSSLWGLNNNNGTNADIDAPEAWDITKGNNNVVIAVIDTGVDYNHSDLAANMWINSGEVPDNGIDDDNNGYIDDRYGYDFHNNDGDPMDDNSHGTHCAGTIAAVGNNATGVVGVNWYASIMALKFLSAGGSGYTSDAVAAVQYATEMKQRGVNVVATSNSWGGGGFSISLYNAISASNILFIAAAGNNGSNNDSTSFYPANYDLDNIISVAATDNYDNMASWSNYGATAVDLAAPGVSIYSTLPRNKYGYMSGTSMATPHVAGVVGLVKATFTSLGPIEVKNKILQSVDVKNSLVGKVLTNGRLNAFGALGGTVIPPDPPVAVFSATPTTGSVPSTVTFTDSSTNNPTAWSWAFGDGGTSTARNPSHIYTGAGSYTVSLTVTNAGGSDDETKVDYITVTEAQEKTMYVSDIDFSTRTAGKNIFLYVAVYVVDGSNNPATPLAGVSVNMSLLNGSKSSSFSGTTGADGSVTFSYKAKPGDYMATVTNLSLSGYVAKELPTSESFELLANGNILQSLAPAMAMAGPQLLQNVPNPFNPETWIPYILTNPEHVVIRIYDISGRMVKNLDMGQKSPGTYTGKDKAAYWDGTNESGEQVSSGIYFYVMEAGQFKGSKRMLIVR